MEVMHSKNNSILDFLIKMRTGLVLLLLIALFSFTTGTFFSTQNAVLIVKHVALYSFIAIGMTFVIITGGIDLSVGSVAGLCGMIAGFLINKGIRIEALKLTIYPSVPVVILICILAGALIGLVNGIFVGHFKIPPFIATLGTMYIARGLALLSSKGHTFPNLGGKAELNNQGFEILGLTRLLGIPVQIWIMLLFVIISSYLLQKTILGHHIYAVGGNIEAARISGIDVNKTIIFAYVFSGVCACMSGLIAASQLLASHPATGEAWEMIAIAATVLGGTSMSGGIGTIGGTITGLFVITVLQDGMVMMGISQFWQKVFTGVVVILAVLFDLYQGKLEDFITYRRALKDRKNEIKT
jgi:ribose/xylose/arabinose/galactoside ABC-type transport system permease subunit